MTTHRHALPPPPPGLFATRVRSAPDDVASPIPVHHWEGGPQDVQPVANPYSLRLRDGSRVRITHRMPWFLGRVEGVTRRTALDAIYAVLLAPRSWSRSGVHWVRVMDPALARVVVAIVPEGQTVCGSGAAGCYSWGHADGPPLAEVESGYVASPEAMSVILGMELCGHGTFRMLDHYNAAHAGYVGVMGDWAACRTVGYFPALHEIDAARTWLRGETPRELIHDD